MAERRLYSAPGDEIETKHPVLVSRYRGVTRLNHWVTALCMIVLLISGFSFFHPSLFWMTGLFGGGQAARSSISECETPRFGSSVETARPAFDASCVITFEWYMREFPLAMQAKYSEVPMTQKRAAS